MYERAPQVRMVLTEARRECEIPKPEAIDVVRQTWVFAIATSTLKC